MVNRSKSFQSSLTKKTYIKGYIPQKTYIKHIFHKKTCIKRIFHFQEHQLRHSLFITQTLWEYFLVLYGLLNIILSLIYNLFLYSSIYFHSSSSLNSVQAMLSLQSHVSIIWVGFLLLHYKYPLKMEMQPSWFNTFFSQQDLLSSKMYVYA